jgi:hypothetical protein
VEIARVEIYPTWARPWVTASMEDRPMGAGCAVMNLAQESVVPPGKVPERPGIRVSKREIG